MKHSRSKLAAAGLLITGLIVGSVVLAPAAAHVGGPIGHLFNHLKPSINDHVARNYSPIMRSQVDSTYLGERTQVQQVQLNSVNINMPAEGFLVISGQAFIRNEDETDTSRVEVQPRINGSALSVNPGTDPENATQRNAIADLAPEEDAFLSYTVTTPIAPGPQTVSQTLEVFEAGISVFFNAKNLTVVWYPANRARQTLTPAN